MPQDVELISGFQFAADKLKPAYFILGLVEAEEEIEDFVIYDAVFYDNFDLFEVLLRVEDADELHVLRYWDVS